MAKLTGGTALGSSEYAEAPSGGPASYVIDGNLSTYWAGNRITASTVQDFIAISFPEPVNVKRVQAMFATWGRTIQIGYADTFSLVKSDYTILRTIDTAAVTVDDFNVLWARNVNNNILLTDNTVSAKVWAILTSNAAGGVLSVNNPNDRMRMVEVELFDTILPDGAVNPKPPVNSPSLPFSATPASWTRTEFKTPGNFSFTPAPDTNMLMVVAQGGGAAGRVNVDLNGNLTPTTGLDGKDALVYTPNGLILTAPGGKTNIIPDPMITGAGLIEADWIRFADYTGRPGTVAGTGNATASVGAMSFLQGTPGAGYSLLPQRTNFPADSNVNTFNVATPTTKLVPELTGAASWNPPTGITIPTSGSTAILRFKGVEGQTITVGFAATAGSKPYSIILNGEALNEGSISTPSATRSITIKVTGDQVLTIALTGNPTGSLVVDYVTFGNYGQGGAYSGASGDAASVFLMPTELNFVVPEGGVGQAGGQTLAANVHGALGSGGTAGGDGGAGAIIIYEFKGVPAYETPAIPDFSNYNRLTEVAGCYRTQYVGVVDNVGGVTSFTHKLRPRSKAALILITGAGGGSRYKAGGNQDSVQTEPTKFNTKTIEYVATSGFSGNITGNGGYGAGGAGGEFLQPDKAIYFEAGTRGLHMSEGGNNFSKVAGRFGSGAPAYYLDKSGGGCGGFGFFAVSARDINDDHTLQFTIANAVAEATPGAVFIYETEADFGPTITQLSEQVLTISKPSDVYVTSESKHVLYSEGFGTTYVSQNAEQILYLEKDIAELQVAHAQVTFVVDPGDPLTYITQNSEHVLFRDREAPTYVSQSSKQILHKVVGVEQTQITRNAQLIFVSEEPSVFWLDFGTLINPVKGQKYTSDMARATSVPPGAMIQIEGPRAAGSTILINDVDVGPIAYPKNNEQVRLISGVDNYYQDLIIVYTYYTEDGETIRERVGEWKVQQPKLTPTKTRAYASFGKPFTWIESKTNHAYSGPPTYLADAGHSAYAQLQADYASGHSEIGTDLQPEFAATHSEYAAFAVSISSHNNHVLASNAGWNIVAAKSALFKTDGAAIQKAKVVLTSQSEWIRTSTHENAHDGFEAVICAQVYYGHVDHEFEQSFTGTVPYDMSTAEIQHVYYGETAQEYEKELAGHVEEAGQEFVAIVHTKYSSLFGMTPMPTIAYSVLTEMDYVHYAGKAYGFWPTPLADSEMLVGKVGYGFVNMQGFDVAKSHPELFGMDAIPMISPEFHEWGTTAFKQSVHSSTFAMEQDKQVAGFGTFETNAIIRPVKASTYAMKSYKAQQMPNGTGAASLYMGFDTKADAESFTEAFAGVTVEPKFNGYVYKLDVDKSFICEIYFNGPVKWLLQGG